MQAVLIHDDGRTEDVTPANGTVFELSEQQALVGGLVQYIDLPSGWVMVCNEEGKLHKLPRNQAATIIAQRAFGDYIVGNVVIAPAEVFGMQPREPMTVDDLEALIAESGVDFIITIDAGEEEPDDDER